MRVTVWLAWRVGAAAMTATTAAAAAAVLTSPFDILAWPPCALRRPHRVAIVMWPSM